MSEGRAIAWMSKADLGATLGEKTVAICAVRHAGIAGQFKTLRAAADAGRGHDERRCTMQQPGSGGSMSSKVRVYEVAKQLNLDPKQVVGLFQAIGVADVRNHMSSVEPEAVERVKRHLEKQRTHDVVEERVRSDGRVVKRRAIAKPNQPSPEPSSVSLPAPTPSVRSLDDVASVTARSTTGTRLPSSRLARRAGVCPPSPRNAAAPAPSSRLRVSERARARCRPPSPSSESRSPCCPVRLRSSVPPTTLRPPPRRHPRSRRKPRLRPRLRPPSRWRRPRRLRPRCRPRLPLPCRRRP